MFELPQGQVEVLQVASRADLSDHVGVGGLPCRPVEHLTELLPHVLVGPVGLHKVPQVVGDAFHHLGRGDDRREVVLNLVDEGRRRLAKRAVLASFAGNSLRLTDWQSLVNSGPGSPGLCWPPPGIRKLPRFGSGSTSSLTADGFISAMRALIGDDGMPQLGFALPCFGALMMAAIR